MNSPRFMSALQPVAFAVFAVALHLVAAISGPEAICCIVSVTTAFLPSGLVAPGGWRRRAAEAALLPVALVLVLVADVGDRHMITAPLLVLAAIGAFAAASRGVSRQRLILLAGALTVSIRAANGFALFDVSPVQLILAMAMAAVMAAGAAHLFGVHAALLAAALAGTLPLVALHQGVLALGTAAGFATLRLPPGRSEPRGIVGWFAGVLPAVLLVSMVSPWGSGAIAHLTAPTLAALAVVFFLLVVSRLLPPAAAGAGWFAAILLFAPAQPVGGPEQPTVLDSVAPEVTLPAASGAPYALDVTLANALALAQGTPVAEIAVGTARIPIRAGVETAEWAHERNDVRAIVEHALPNRPIWRPNGPAPRTEWAVSGTMTLDVPAGTAPVVRRSSLLPDSSRVIITAIPGAGPATGRVSAPATWVVAAAVVVALLQIAGAALGGPTSWLPWVLLETGVLAAHVPIEPVASLGQMCLAELTLAAVLAAWIVPARRWFSRGRFFLAGATLLVPLAVATPEVSQPLGDDTYHLLLMESLTHDGDFDISNNFDTDLNPNQSVYQPYAKTFIHSPALAVVLAPGYYLAGRSGAAVPLALAGAALLALAMNRARQLGVPHSKVALLSMLLLLSYPLTTFSTQLWTEVPGALLALGCAVPFGAPPVHRLLAASFAILATLLKTRLALVTLPPAAVVWLGLRPGRRALGGFGVVCVIAAAGWVLAAAIVGNPLDPLGRRHFTDLVPHSLSQPLVVLGGLAFDAAGGLAFSAPLLLISLFGLRRLWRQGKHGERALVLGGILTVAALLHVVEWRGGDSPPARYLVPLWGGFALASAFLLARPHPWRSVLRVLVPPTLAVWWIGTTHPNWLVNVGDGGFWLADLLSARLGADALDFFPSFLRPSPATWLVPGILTVVTLATGAVVRRHRPLGRLVGRASVALWLVGGAAFLVALGFKTDRAVELEDPQVIRHGGVSEPPDGTFSRFLRANGVRLKDGDRVIVPLRLPHDPEVTLVGWLDDGAREAATLWIAWSGGRQQPVHVAGDGAGSVTLPGGRGGVRESLSIRFEATHGGTAVLDRLLITSR